MAEKNKNKNSVIRFVTGAVAALTAAAALFCAAQAVVLFTEYRNGDKAYGDFAASFMIAALPEAKDGETAAAAVSESEAINSAAQTGADIKADANKETAAGAPPVSVDFDSLKKINPDIAGWIYSPGTKINYPIVACGSEDDYAFYLKHLFNGAKNKLGTLFCDYRSVPFDTEAGGSNTIIYGHNMINGTMFSSLLDYRSQSYYKAHPAMYLYTPSGNYKIELFAAFMTTTSSDAYELGAKGGELRDYIGRAMKNSVFTSQAELPESGSVNIVTLSTCDNNTSENRFVVLGFLKPWQD